mmetsp:Transcript_76600/g.127614  ORF Transcript_76600/g.127614 Transcript_76600/m.127614 type:complete len:214 (-) Transcript_76600:574-1215(-)
MISPAASAIVFFNVWLRMLSAFRPASAADCNASLAQTSSKETSKENESRRVRVATMKLNTAMILTPPVWPATCTSMSPNPENPPTAAKTFHMAIWKAVQEAMVWGHSPMYVWIRNKGITVNVCCTTTRLVTKVVRHSSSSCRWPSASSKINGILDCLTPCNRSVLCQLIPSAYMTPRTGPMRQTMSFICFWKAGTNEKTRTVIPRMTCRIGGT